MKIRFVQVENGWEIREMYGRFIYRVRGQIRLVTTDGSVWWWRVVFHTGESWYADVLDILLLFDLSEMYLSGGYESVLTEIQGGT
jgi:hypothetical protein